MRYYSRGKLLIAGEYLVLKGAKALAVPLTKGQDLRVQETKFPGELKWISKETGKTWFTAKINTTFFQLLESSDTDIAGALIRVLQAARKLNPEFLTRAEAGYEVLTQLEFNREWGFGSSSTLLSNIASWAKVDPMKLHREVSDGSGYDVICGRQDGPCFFKLNAQAYQLEKASFDPPFHQQLFFIYLGNKQKSDTSVARFLKENNTLNDACNTVSELAEQMEAASSLDDFEYAMKAHEFLLSGLLKKEKLKQSWFSDLPGEIKSLGAWGGDFALMTWHEDYLSLKKYLEHKKIKTLFSYKTIVKNW